MRRQHNFVVCPFTNHEPRPVAILTYFTVTPNNVFTTNVVFDLCLLETMYHVLERITDRVELPRGGVLAFRAVVREPDGHGTVERRVELDADGRLVGRTTRTVHWNARPRHVAAPSAVLSFRAVVVEP